MDRIWIGDFHFNPLKTFNKDTNSGFNDTYILEDFADQTWLDTVAATELEKLTPTNCNIIVMVGLQDCINSCLHSNIDIKDIAKDFIDTLEFLQSNNRNNLIYFCSVPPVDGAHSCAAGDITAIQLNNKIAELNKEIKENCPVEFIDCNEYLINTILKTQDGIHYLPEISEALESFIIYNLKEFNLNISSSSFEFKPRTTAPVIRIPNNYKDSNGVRSTKEVVIDPDIGPNDHGYPKFKVVTYGNAEMLPEDTNLEGIYWIKKNYGGESPHLDPSQASDVSSSVPTVPGSTLPNCTAYAWGRFYEITGEYPKLCTRNAKYWWGYREDGYERGDRESEPRLGAVICWDHNDAGHVGIVEQINYDENGNIKSIVTSESGWNCSWYFRTKERNNSDGNWNGGPNYRFQGFIYPPIKQIDSSNVCIKSGQAARTATLDDMKINAQYIWNYFRQPINGGWTLNAVAGMLGNMQIESHIMPRVWGGWENDLCEYKDNSTGKYIVTDYGKGIAPRSDGKYFKGGYGLTQWTHGYGKPDSPGFIMWCEARNLPYWEMDTQLKKIKREVDLSSPYNNEGWVNGESVWNTHTWKWAEEYTLSFYDYTHCTKSPEWCGGCFVCCYEKPASVLDDHQESSACLKRKNTIDARGEKARFWYDYLLGLGNTATFNTSTESATDSSDDPYVYVENENATATYVSSISIINDEDLKVSAVKTDSLTPTEATISFLTKNYKNGSYKLFQNKQEKKKADLNLKKGLNTLKLTGLTPNTTYKIELSILGSFSDNNLVEETLEFTTPQDYPSAITSIEFVPNNRNDLTKDCTLKIKKPDYLGYYKTSSGYDLILFVNGQEFKTIEIANAIDITETAFNLKQKFNYTHKLADSIQVGVRTWVKTGGTKLYDKTGPIVSKPINSLTSTVTPYLNIE